MKSKDVTALYNQVPLGAIVQIVPDRLPKASNLPPTPLIDTLMARGEETRSRDRVGSARRTERATPSMNKRASIVRNSPSV
jgi:hypothetical protein